MSLEKPRVIGIDGLHRVGKDTQTKLLAQHLDKLKIPNIIVRGDGTRDGQGLTEGDPYDRHWQQRGLVLRNSDSTVEGWNASSYVLLTELHDHIATRPTNSAIISDRSLVSRSAFLLHRGVGLRGERFTLDELYPDHNSETAEFDLEEVVPDVIFDMQASDISALLARLDPTDPKYVFRARNIRSSFDISRTAFQHLPPSIEERVHVIDAHLPIETIHQDIVSSLGNLAIL